MKTPLLLLLFTSLALALRAEVEVEIASDHDGDHRKAFSYVITKSVLDRQPQWKPGTQPCPLSQETAIGIALKWLEHQAWKDAVKLKEIALSRVLYGESWYYFFSFGDRVFDETPPPGGVYRRTHPSSVLVLLDGSIVEAKDLRKKPKK